MHIKVFQEALDQVLHFLWAAVALAPVCIASTWYMGALSGLLLAAPREFVDQWHGWPIGWRKLMDLGFFILGGAFVGGIL